MLKGEFCKLWEMAIVNTKSVIWYLRQSNCEIHFQSSYVHLKHSFSDHTVYCQPRFLRLVISTAGKYEDSVKLSLTMILPGSPFVLLCLVSFGEVEFHRRYLVTVFTCWLKHRFVRNWIQINFILFWIRILWNYYHC